MFYLFLEIIDLHCLLSNVKKQLFHIFSSVFLVESKKCNPWPIAEVLLSSLPYPSQNAGYQV